MNNKHDTLLFAGLHQRCKSSAWSGTVWRPQARLCTGGSLASGLAGPAGPGGRRSGAARARRHLPAAAGAPAHQRRVRGLLRRHREGERADPAQLPRAGVAPGRAADDAVALQHVAGAPEPATAPVSGTRGRYLRCAPRAKASAERPTSSPPPCLSRGASPFAQWAVGRLALLGTTCKRVGTFSPRRQDGGGSLCAAPQACACSNTSMRFCMRAVTRCAFGAPIADARRGRTSTPSTWRRQWRSRSSSGPSLRATCGRCAPTASLSPACHDINRNHSTHGVGLISETAWRHCTLDCSTPQPRGLDRSRRLCVSVPRASPTHTGCSFTPHAGASTHARVCRRLKSMTGHRARNTAPGARSTPMCGVAPSAARPDRARRPPGARACWPTCATTPTSSSRSSPRSARSRRPAAS